MTKKKAPARPKKKAPPKLKTQPTTKSVDAFLEGIEEEDRRRDALELLALMKKATKKKPRMWGTAIVGFGDLQYQYASGQIGDWFQAGFSPRKAALTIYLMGGLKAHASMLPALGKYKMGGGCLYIRRLGDVDRSVLSRLIEATVALSPDRAARG